MLLPPRCCGPSAGVVAPVRSRQGSRASVSPVKWDTSRCSFASLADTPLDPDEDAAVGAIPPRRARAANVRSESGPRQPSPARLCSQRGGGGEGFAAPRRDSREDGKGARDTPRADSQDTFDVQQVLLLHICKTHCLGD